MDKIGNTDGVNLDSCRNAVVEDVWIQNSDDGVCIKSGLNVRVGVAIVYLPPNLHPT